MSSWLWSTDLYCKNSRHLCFEGIAVDILFSLHHWGFVSTHECALTTAVTIKSKAALMTAATIKSKAALPHLLVVASLVEYIAFWQKKSWNIPGIWIPETSRHFCACYLYGRNQMAAVSFQMSDLVCYSNVIWIPEHLTTYLLLTTWIPDMLVSDPLCRYIKTCKLNSGSRKGYLSNAEKPQTSDILLVVKNFKHSGDLNIELVQ